MPMLRLALLASVVLGGAQRASAASRPVVRPGLGQAVDVHLSALHAIDAFNGVVLVARGDEVLLSKGYGLADHEKQVGWAPDTISCVGSITTQFTAACIMRLVEQGKVREDETPFKPGLAAWPVGGGEFRSNDLRAGPGARPSFGESGGWRTPRHATDGGPLGKKDHD